MFLFVGKSDYFLLPDYIFVKGKFDGVATLLVLAQHHTTLSQQVLTNNLDGLFKIKALLVEVNGGWGCTCELPQGID